MTEYLCGKKGLLKKQTITYKRLTNPTQLIAQCPYHVACPALHQSKGLFVLTTDHLNSGAVASMSSWGVRSRLKLGFCFGYPPPNPSERDQPGQVGKYLRGSFGRFFIRNSF